jgi:hypothetical protein
MKYQLLVSDVWAEMPCFRSGYRYVRSKVWEEVETREISLNDVRNLEVLLCGEIFLASMLYRTSRGIPLWEMISCKHAVRNVEVILYGK